MAPTCWATQTIMLWITLSRRVAITIWKATLSTTSLTDRKGSALPTRETISSQLTSHWTQELLGHPTKTPTSSRIRTRVTALFRPLQQALKEVLTNVQATHSPAKPLVVLRTRLPMYVSRTHLKVAFLETLSLRMLAGSVLVGPAQALRISSVMISPIINAATTTIWFELLKKLQGLSAL